MDNSTEIISHPNGTTSVISVLQVKDPKNQVGNEVICQVQHLGTLTDFRQALNNGKRTWATIAVVTPMYTHRKVENVLQNLSGS